MRKANPYLVFVLLLVASFSLATLIQPQAVALQAGRESESFLAALLGEGRRLFANHFFVKADVYFHSGYYPSIFDQAQAPKDARHMTGDEHGQEPHEDEHATSTSGETHAEGGHEESEHEKEMNFLKPPRDWIERFGRNFIIAEHTHLEAGKANEILPWLRLSAELDPQRVETYTLAAYWLRKRLQRVKEADQFLRDGLKANPNSYEILFELGRLYFEDYHDVVRARNVWELALQKWTAQESGKKEPDLQQLGDIAENLSRLEEGAGNLARAIDLLRLAMKATPRPDLLQKQIDELQQRASPSQATSPSP
jgi:tetratricopeptide (TPR) repeat protein